MRRTFFSLHEIMARGLEEHEDYRVLRSVPGGFFNMPPGTAPDGKCAVLVDVETTGLDAEQDRLIELAVLPVWLDDAGDVVAHYKPVSWLEDPRVPLSPTIGQLTGLTDEDLKGKSIDDDLAFALIDRADVLIAHNAKFDAQWIERRYPPLAGKPWACSASEIDWLSVGFDGRAQQHLLQQHGWFANAHRAADDVWSLFHLLRQYRPDPDTGEMRTHFARLLEKSEQPGERIEAVNAPFSKKDSLKARGYRWSPGDRVWSKELDLGSLDAERAWFAHQGLPPFRTHPVTACERHR